MLRAQQRELDEGRGGIKREQNISFDEWADQYEQIIETKNLKPRTIDGYTETLSRARDAFGSLNLREISNSELRRFDKSLGKIADASKLRYYRELGACFSQALKERKGWLEANPVPPFVESLNLRKPKRGKAPFGRSELARLWVALRKADPVYLYVARFSSETGLRLRELVGLDWHNVALLNGEVTVEAQYQERNGLVLPKDGEVRTIHLTRHARRVLEQWGKISGSCDGGPVFPHPQNGGRLSAQVVQDRFAAAMTNAVIPKIHPKLRLPRSFHSLRYSASVLMQQRGYHPRLIEQTLGHSSLELSLNLYGGWGPDELAKAASNPG